MAYPSNLIRFRERGAPVQMHVFVAATIDDLMREVMESVRTDGIDIVPSEGACREITGAVLELTDPRARLSRTESRGKAISALGELCWYLAGSDNLGFATYYIAKYEEYAIGDSVVGAYGPRLGSIEEPGQLANVIAILRRKPTSRQAVIQLFDAADTSGPSTKGAPCTCTLQFLLREGRLDCIVYMRSNDVVRGLPHDAFAFTMIQELVARSLGAEVGTYKHFVGSLHIYVKDQEQVERYLNEGWQSTERGMPAMPIGDPWPSVRDLLAAEVLIRDDGTGAEVDLANVHPYWADLIRLLQVYAVVRDPQGLERDRQEFEALRAALAHQCYHAYVDAKVSRRGANR